MSNSNEYFSQKKIAKIFGKPISKTTFFNAEEEGGIPRGKRFRLGAINLRGWDMESLPSIGEKWGFLKKFDRPLAISIFTTKGGVLKTTLALNLARMSALHNIKTCVVGLDMQGDITNALGYNDDFEEHGDLKTLIQKLNDTKGLSDVFNRTSRVTDIIMPTDIPTLHFIPETPELAAFNESLSNINRREYWLKEKVVDPLKEFYDLIIMDCSPNWNRLITNALVASDFLLSPLECKINNFRNFKVFRYFLKEFKNEMQAPFQSIFIPTRYAPSKKLSMEIKDWYLENISGCTKEGIREGLHSEEASALKLSLPEHAPTKIVADEMRSLLIEIWNQIEHYNSREKKSSEKQVKNEKIKQSGSEVVGGISWP